MANNNKKYNAKAEAKRKNTAKPSAPMTKKQKIFTAIAGVLIVAIVAGLVVWAVLAITDDGKTDYLKDDLSKYITLLEEDYKNIVVKGPFEEYTDEDLTWRINSLLAQNKSETPLYDGLGAKDVPITIGDLVSFFYRGYTVDADGNEVDIPLASNLSGNIVKVEVGTNLIIDENTQKRYFIPGFVDELIGKKPSDYDSFKPIGEGTVSAGDVIYISYTAIYPGNAGNYKQVSCERVDLSDENLDKKYGKGFVDFILGTKEGTEAAKIGEKLSPEPFEYSSEGSVGYTDMKIEFVTRGCEDNPLVIDVRFPADYVEESLRGKTVKFDVYMANAVIYDTPTFTAEFITDTLKVKESELLEYEGADVVAKYKKHLEKLIRAEIKDINETIISDAIWAHLDEKAVIKEYPEDTVKEYYDAYYNELAAQYAQNSTAYESLDAYATSKLGLKTGEDWRDVLTKNAENVTREKIIFYYIIREEGFIPSGTEFDNLYGKIYNEHLDYYINLHSEELSKLTEEEYAKEVEIIKEELNEYYTVDYFTETVYYEYGTAKMIEYLAITPVG